MLHPPSVVLTAHCSLLATPHHLLRRTYNAPMMLHGHISVRKIKLHLPLPLTLTPTPTPNPHPHQVSVLKIKMHYPYPYP